MIETPNNYEEALIFLKGDINNQVVERRKKLFKIRMVLMPVIFISVLGTLGVILGLGPTGLIVSIPFSILSAFLPELLAYIKVKKFEKSLIDNSYFENSTEEQVINMARDTIDFYNKVIVKEEGKK
ncbi:MAG: hypothetical protein E7239_10905 [Sarcina sp.]|nr:hypothetical protein [Sarcina sp.]